LCVAHSMPQMASRWNTLRLLKASRCSSWQIPVEIRPCPIVREESGLALSSRNALLSESEKRIAVCISQALKTSVEFAKSHSVKETHDLVFGALNATNGLEVEYFEIVNGITLQL
jgi:pantoate--beta-alanine ligase